jgi:methionine-rich copper-binding protein CopC
MKKLIALLSVVVGATFLLGGTPAFANSIQSTTPASGETLEIAPSAITFTTDQIVMDIGSEVTVVDAVGNRVDDGTLTINENSVVAGLKTLTRGGVYTVTYSFLSENDAPLAGSFRFNFAQPQVISTPTAQPTPTQASAPTGNNAGTTLFVFGLLLASVVVTIALARYARKIFSEK